MKVNSNRIIVEVYANDIDPTGILNLTKPQRYRPLPIGDWEADVPRGIMNDAFKESFPLEVVFPTPFTFYSAQNKTDIRYTGVRKFNIPKNCDINSFITCITGIDLSETIKKIITYNGELKYSELITCLNECHVDTLIQLCESYEGNSWLVKMIDEATSELDRKKASEMPVMKKEELKISTMIALKRALSSGKLWDTECIVDEIARVRIQKNGDFIIFADLGGDTFEIKIDDKTLTNNISIPFSSEDASVLLILFNNRNLLGEIIAEATAQYKIDTENKALQKMLIDSAEAKNIALKKQIEQVLLNPAVQQAMLLKKKAVDYNGYIATETKLSIDKDFLLNNFEVLKAMGIIKYLDLSKIDLSEYDLDGLDLSNSNISLVLNNLKRKSLNGTNLENVPLLGQSLASFDIRGANLRGTHAFIDYGSTTFDETTIFDETCEFFRQDGSTISYEVLRALGYHIEQVSDDIVDLKI